MANQSNFLDDILYNVMMAESSGFPLTVGKDGERGLYQYKRDTWRASTKRIFGKPKPFLMAYVPSMAKQVARADMEELIKEFGENPRLLTSAWNRGPEVARLIRQGKKSYILNHKNDIYRYVLNTGKLWKLGVKVAPRRRQ